MPELTFLSEYQGANKSAWVCRDEQKRFVAIAYQAGIEQCRETFSIESAAEDWAEDWVLLNTSV